MVFIITCAHALVPMPSRFAVIAASGASWRIAFKSRVNALPRSAAPMKTGITRPSRQVGGQIVETSSLAE